MDTGDKTADKTGDGDDRQNDADDVAHAEITFFRTFCHNRTLRGCYSVIIQPYERPFLRMVSILCIDWSLRSLRSVAMRRIVRPRPIVRREVELRLT